MEIVFQGCALVEVQKPPAVSFVVQLMWVCVCVYECAVIVQPFGSTSIDLLAVQRAHLTASLTLSSLLTVQRPIVDIKNRPRIPIPDEDPYSVAGNGSNGSSGSSGFGSGHQQQLQQQQHQQQQLGKHLNNGSSGHVAATREQLLLQTQQLAHKRSEKPPKLPPRDNAYAHDLIPKVSQLAANWHLRLPKCFVGECWNTCCWWSSWCFVVVVVDARNKNNIFGSAKTHIIRARSVATSSAPTTTTTVTRKKRGAGYAWLHAQRGHLQNGLWLLLCAPHTPVPASPPSCSHPRSSVAQTSDWNKYQATCCGDDFAADIVVVCVCVCLVVVKLQQAFGLHSIIFEFQQQANK